MISDDSRSVQMIQDDFKISFFSDLHMVWVDFKLFKIDLVNWGLFKMFCMISDGVRWFKIISYYFILFHIILDVSSKLKPI